MDEIRYSLAIWLLTLTTSFRSHKYSYNLRSVMQQRFSSSTLGYPWINYRKRTRNVSKYKETHMRGDAFLPNGGNTQVTSFLLFRQCNWTRSKKKNTAHRFQLFHPPALMGRVQGPVVQGRVYLLPLQILYRFLNSLCNITGAFVKSVLSHKGACHKIYRNSATENCHQIARNQKNNRPRR